MFQYYCYTWRMAHWLFYFIRLIITTIILYFIIWSQRNCQQSFQWAKKNLVYDKTTGEMYCTAVTCSPSAKQLIWIHLCHFSNFEISRSFSNFDYIFIQESNRLLYVQWPLSAVAACCREAPRWLLLPRITSKVSWWRFEFRTSSMLVP